MKSADNIAILVVRRRPFGHMLMPYFLKKVSNTMFEVDGIVTPLMIEGIKEISPKTKEIVSLSEIISEQKITKFFSRNKTTKSFIESLTDVFIKETIRPYIDKYICKMLPLIADSKLPVFLRDEKYKEVGESDRIDVAPLYKCRPRFFFTINETSDLFYTLKVSDGVSEASLFSSDYRELSASPAVFVANRTLYSFEGIESKKFVPFVGRQRIRVESKMVGSYMEKFVLNCLRLYRVSAYGFDIITHNSSFKPVLFGVRTITGCVFELQFQYEGALCRYGDKIKQVKLNVSENGRYSFDVFLRNFSEENKIAYILLRDTGLLQYNGHFYIDGHPNFSDLAVWSNEQIDFLQSNDISVVLIDNDERYFFGKWSLQSSLIKENDWFDMRIVVEIGPYNIPFSHFFKNIVNGDSRYVLPDGQVFVMPDEWFEQWNLIIPLVSKGVSDEYLRLNGSYYKLLPEYVGGIQQQDSLSTTDNYEDIRLKGHIEASLRGYQHKGVQWMVHLSENNRGGILADDMGLGKTIQTAALLSNFFSQSEEANRQHLFQTNMSGLTPALIVMPVSLLHNWRSELQRFTPHLNLLCLTGKQLASGSGLAKVLLQYHIILTTYSNVRIYADVLQKMSFSYLILDESQVVKNPASKTYSAIASLHAANKINLSGTPVENSLADLWAQINLVNPGMLGTRAYFDHFFRTPIEKNADEARMSRLKMLTQPYILRRTKCQVLTELPPLTVQTIDCTMTDEQHDVYEREKSACRNMLWNDNVNNTNKRFMALQALTRLRLIANHPSLCRIDYEGGSGKTDIVVEYIKSIANTGHKMLVFSSFVRDLTLIASIIDNTHIKYETLIGSTRDRETVIRRFNNTPDISVFFISLKAGGVGLNLTCADYVLMLNPWWNPAAETQAYNRVHRMGQKNSVTVYRFITSGSIEEKINTMQERKRKLSEEVLDENNVVAPPSDEELDLLLNDSDI